MKIIIVEIKPLLSGGFTVLCIINGDKQDVEFGPGVSDSTSDLHMVVMKAIIALIGVVIDH